MIIRKNTPTLLKEKDTALDFSPLPVLYGANFLYNINLHNE